MKIAKVNWDGEIGDNLLIETVQDVFDYQEHLARNTSSTFHKVIDSRIPVDRWDHYGNEGQYGNSFNMAVQKCKIFGGRPILEFDKITNDKCISILKQINQGNKVLINKVGGWCPVMESLHTILSVSEYTPDSDRKVVINSNTKYMNLENDPQLEKRTIEYLSSVDKNYSYVLRLCEYSKEELQQVFENFKSAGGKIIYIYTTGSNVHQMWEYSEAIIKAGILYVEFEFNSGYDDKHKEVVHYLRDGGVKVTLVN